MRLSRNGKGDEHTDGVTQQDGTVRVKIGKVSKPSMNIHLVTDKDKYKFIFDCEMIIRKSLEYKQYIEYLKEYRDMTRCAYFNNVKNTASKRSKVRLHIHHEPFTLFDITNTIVNKYIAYDLPLDYFDIASDVMDLHYKNMVGLIPLSVTVHKLVHLGRLFIPLQIVDGNFIRFYDEYEEWIPTEVKEILYKNFEISRDIHYGTTEYDTSILDRKYIFIEQDGIILPQLIDEGDTD